VALLRLPLAFMPEVDEPRLFLHVPFPNATPEQCERLIARPLEEALGSVKGIMNMNARCEANDARIRLEFEWGHELNLARAEVLERIDRIRGELPDTIGDITVGGHWNSREADEPVLEGRLSSNRDLSESYDLLERKIIRPLERIPGVGAVRLDGLNPKEVRINLRVEDLEAHSIDVREVTLDGNFAVGVTVTAEAGANAVEIGDVEEPQRSQRRGGPAIEARSYAPQHQPHRADHPERWAGAIRNWTPVGAVLLNPERRSTENADLGYAN